MKNKTCLYPDILELIIHRSEKEGVRFVVSELEFMAIALDTFLSDAIDKYIKGQKEHGGSILDRDLDHEIYQEHIDLFWYSWANARKNAEQRTGTVDFAKLTKRTVEADLA